MPKKIYLVEDDAAIIDVYSLIIKRADIEVDVISIGADVLKKLQAAEKGEEKMPDLVLLDLILPDMNGMDILSQMKKNPATKDIPVFILSNQTETKIEDASLRPDKFIIKADTSPTDLLKIIQEQLK
jgi:DNA-binding response OmpR family regulator